MRIIRSNQKNAQGLAIAGKIKIGEKHAEKGYPMALDYFRPHTENVAYIEAFKNTYGEKPKSIQIIFVSDDISHVCAERIELRDKAGKLYARGDGQNFEVVKDGNFVMAREEDIIKHYGTIENFKEKKVAECASPTGWREILTLRFILPKIKGLLAEWEFNTYADDSSIPQIVATFDHVQQMAGSVRMIPFDLNVKKVKSDKAGNAHHYPVVQLVPNLSAENMLALREFIEQGIVTMSTGLLTDDKIMQIAEQNPKIIELAEQNSTE
jgi:hypothetical protein